MIADSILNFTKRFLFYSAFLLILPLLYTNSIELQHQQQLLNHNYQSLVYKIDQLSESQKDSLKAYLNNETSFQYNLLFIIPFIFLLIELAEIYYQKQEDQPIAYSNNNQSVLPPPPILQPKVISEYVYDKNEEIMQIESFYRNQKKQTIIEESKVQIDKKQENPVDFLDKLQFTVDSRQQEKVAMSDYDNKQLAMARHLGRMVQQEYGQYEPHPPMMKTVRTQTIRENLFTQQTTKQFDPTPQTQMYVSLGELAFLQLLFGYVIGVQTSLTISIPLIVLASFLKVNQFGDWILYSNLSSYISIQTCDGHLSLAHIDDIHIVNVDRSLPQSLIDRNQLLHHLRIPHQTVFQNTFSLDHQNNINFIWNFSIFYFMLQSCIFFVFLNKQLLCIYMQFPPTSGKIIIDTSHGELEVELWCKEVPKGCKNFIQLCLNGYYDNCKFHRLFPNFMIQGGDPTGTGEGGSSCYGQPFQDEFHSRLTFITRGLLAYSNEGANTNESQFFITLDACTWLDKKHTIFGRVVGNTIYNLMSMNQVDTDQNDQPITAIFIKSTQVIIDPFNLCLKQIEPTEEDEKPIQVQEIVKPPPKVKPKTKNISLLSFGDEEEQEEMHCQQQKIGNSHDRLNDPKLKKELVVTQEELEVKKKKQQEEEVKKNQLKQAVSNPNNTDNQQRQKTKRFEINEAKLELNEEDKKLLNYQIRKNEKGEIQYIFNQSESSSNSESSEIEDEEQRKIREQQIDEYEKLKADFLQFKENKFGSNNAMIKDRLEHEKKLLSTVESRRQRFIQGMKEKQHYEAYEEKVSQLKDKLKDDRIMSDKYHWLNHKLKFHVDSASAFSVVDTKQQVSDYHATELVTEDTYKLKKEKKSINKLLQLSE